MKYIEISKYTVKGIIVISILFSFSACKNYLNVVPDHVATLDNAFHTAHEAKKYLFTCYSYMPKNGDDNDDPGILGGDELWRLPNYNNSGYFRVARGQQSVGEVLGARWKRYFRAIRDCNIFLNNIMKVPDLEEYKKRKWSSEVKFLKAYYNFYLMKMYGPIPLMKHNSPTNITIKDAKVMRAPIDSCFDYVINLINEALPYLPSSLDDPTDQLGRVDWAIALAMKAKIMVYRASPLFNGNTDYADFKNPNGEQLFPQAYSQAKWDSAAIICKNAITACLAVGKKLYYFPSQFQQYALSDTIVSQMSIRNSVCKSWNSGIIWGNTQSADRTKFTQTEITPHLDPTLLNNTVTKGQFSPPLNFVALFYTNHGVPIDEDKTWGYNDRFNLKTSKDRDKLYIKEGYTTAHFNFDRGPRFYADMGFDGGIWYGQGRYNDKDAKSLFHIEAKYGQKNGYGKPHHGTITGYFLKKLDFFQNVESENDHFSVTPYAFPIMRLADLYLLYAEALNESEDQPGAEVYKYINLVRARAGLLPVQDAWTMYSTNLNKFKTKEGMRDIIHRERTLELAFEGHRFWDLRRWKEAAKVYNEDIKSWKILQKTAEEYYKPKVIFHKTFNLRDYFYPLKESTLENNKNMIQSFGW